MLLLLVLFMPCSWYLAQLSQSFKANVHIRLLYLLVQVLKLLPPYGIKIQMVHNRLCLVSVPLASALFRPKEFQVFIAF